MNKEIKSISTILVIQTAFIGDAILATALLEKLHTFYPNAAIDFMVRKGNEPLFIDHPFLNKVLVWNKQDEKYKSLFNLLKQIRKTKYDVVINAQRFAATGVITALSKAKQTIGFNKNPFSFLFTHSIKHIIGNAENALHEVDRNQMLIEHLTDNKAAMPKLYPTKNDEDFVAKYKEKNYVCIAPASVWYTKQFPVSKWIELIKILANDINIYLIGANSDATMCNEIVAATKNNVVSLAGKLNLLQSTALIKDATMNYVNDSAPMHLASAVNAHVTAIYCSTLPSFGFGPLSTNKKIVEVATPLTCRPCGLHGKTHCPQQHFNCAMKIKAEDILSMKIIFLDI